MLLHESVNPMSEIRNGLSSMMVAGKVPPVKGLLVHRYASWKGYALLKLLALETLPCLPATLSSDGPAVPLPQY